MKHESETERIKEELYQKVFIFMAANRITCKETIYQCDWVIENAYEFIEDLFEIIETKLPKTEYED